MTDTINPDVTPLEPDPLAPPPHCGSLRTIDPLEAPAPEHCGSLITVEIIPTSTRRAAPEKVAQSVRGRLNR